MNYRDIKNFNERCNSHPDHQKGIITERMLSDRLHEEILELRMYIEGREWVGLTEDEVMILAAKAGFYIDRDESDEDESDQLHWLDGDGGQSDDLLFKLRDLIEAKLKEKNT